MARRQISFVLRLAPAAPVTLTASDRQAIERILRAFHAALAARDSQRVRGLYGRAAQEERKVYPEGVEFHENLLTEGFAKMLASPVFKMRPLQMDGLQYAVDGKVVTVRRQDGGPVMESAEVEVDDEIVITGPGGKEVRQKTRFKTRMAPRSLAFKQFDGIWHMTFGFGF